MFLAVIRGDLINPLFIADVEPKSTASPSVEPPLGQAKYVSRPNVTNITAYCAAQSPALVVDVGDLIDATVPVGGPVDIRAATIRAVSGLGAATDAQVLALQGFLAYSFVETDLVKKSFLYGNLAAYRAAGFNPDPRRVPTLGAAAAIAMVQADFHTAFVVAVPTITTAVLAGGNLTVNGSGFTATGLFEVTVVLTGTGARKVRQDQILAGGGTISDTVIYLPAALVGATPLLAAIAQTTTSARVRVNDILSAAVAVTV
jgi:hypothetical protein